MTHFLHCLTCLRQTCNLFITAYGIIKCQTVSKNLGDFLFNIADISSNEAEMKKTRLLKITLYLWSLEITPTVPLNYFVKSTALS